MNALSLFADILDYPTDAVIGQTEMLTGLLSEGGNCDQGCELLNRFCASCRQVGIGRLQEIYTTAFDMRAEGSLYAGYHLFGDQWPRSSFLAQLRKCYRSHSFDAGTDLPDQISVILRFVADHPETEESEDLLRHCLAPSIDRIQQNTPESNPYHLALAALLLHLQSQFPLDGNVTMQSAEGNEQHL